MQGYRFYAVMPESRRSKAASKRNGIQFPWTISALKRERESGYGQFRCDLIAVYLGADGRPIYQGAGHVVDAMATAIEGNALSYCTTGVDLSYLRNRSIRVSEELARKLSPELFQRLES